METDKEYFKEYLRAIDNPLPEMEGTFKQEGEFITKLIKSSGAKKIVEFGCGAGRTLQNIAGNYPKNTFYGIDYDSKMVLEALRRTANLPNVNIKYGDIADTKFPNGFMDMCFSTYNLVGDIPPRNLSDLMEEKRRILKQGGIALAITWKKDLGFLRKYYESIGISISKINNNVTETSHGSFYRFSPDKLEKFFLSHGFISIERFDVGPAWYGVQGIKL